MQFDKLVRQILNEAISKPETLTIYGNSFNTDPNYIIDQYEQSDEKRIGYQFRISLDKVWFYDKELAKVREYKYGYEYHTCNISLDSGEDAVSWWGFDNEDLPCIYTGNNFKQAFETLSNNVENILKNRFNNEDATAIRQNLNKLYDLSNIPGQFKIFHHMDYPEDPDSCIQFYFLFEIDMVQYSMQHILDAGSEGVSEEDNILDW